MVQDRVGVLGIGFCPGNGFGMRKALGLRAAPPGTHHIVFQLLLASIGNPPLFSGQHRIGQDQRGPGGGGRQTPEK